MTLRIFSSLKGYQKFAVSITSVFVVGVSAYIVLFNLMSFDGAFNTQAAINLYHKGTLALNYRSNLALQTLLPFQIVNGFFLTIFGNTLLAANLANIFFYLILFGLFTFLTCRYQSSLPMLAFICISSNIAFLAFGFGGYGEIPALTFGLLGVSFLVFKKDSYMGNSFAGMFIACAITTKWVLFLILPSVFLTLFLLKPDKKKLLCFLLPFILTSIIVGFIQFSPIEFGKMEKLFRALINQNLPHHGSEYFPQQVNNLKTYGLHLSENWKAYSSFSFGFNGFVKIILSFLMVVMAIHILIRRREKLESIKILYIFLSFFLFVYLFWAFALNSRWPIRRILNTDVLFYLGLSLLPCVLQFGKIGRYATFLFLAVFLIGNILILFLYAKQNHFTSVINYETQMREGLKLLPKGYIGYGQGHLEAPHWSFLAKKNFHDLLRDSVFYNCIESNCNNFLFLQPTNPLNNPQLNYVKELFNLKDIFDYMDFKLQRSRDLIVMERNMQKKLILMREGATYSIAQVKENARYKMYSPPFFEFNEMAVFLDNKKAFNLLEINVYGAQVSEWEKSKNSPRK